MHMNAINQFWDVQQGKYFYYNAGIYHNGSKAYLVDPGMTANEVFSIREHLAATGLECEGVILTHFHWDHLLGINSFGNCNLMVYEKFPKELQSRFNATQLSINKWAAEENERKIDIPILPFAAMLVKDGFIQPIGDHHLAILYTPGHTADHISVYDPQSGTFWAGDILSDLEIPFISDSIIAYIDTLEKISTLNFTTIIPGHGSPAQSHAEAQKRITDDLVYLHDLADRVQKCVQVGETLEDTIKLCEDIPIRFPDDNKQPHQWNIESAYQVLGGNCAGKITGWEKEWEGL